MIKVRVTVVVIVLILIVAAIAFFMMGGPTAEDFAHLADPRIAEMPAQKMLVVEAKGDPNVVGSDAFGLLFKLYYQVPGAAKGPSQPAPRARWPIDLETPKAGWVGRYGLPVPYDTGSAPEHDSADGMTVSIETWEYGDVAEVLHVGPYDQEEPTVDRLKTFIDDQGYTINGEHEEEYVKGPGMFFKGNPEKYLTIIRYSVTKSAGS